MPMTLTPSVSEATDAPTLKTATTTTTSETTATATTADSAAATSLSSSSSSSSSPSELAAVTTISSDFSVPKSDVLPVSPTNGTTVPSSKDAQSSLRSFNIAELTRSASSNDIHDFPPQDAEPHLRKAFSDVDLAHLTSSDNTAAVAAAATAHPNAVARARAQSAADVTVKSESAPHEGTAPRRRGSGLFNGERQRSISNTTTSTSRSHGHHSNTSPPSTADKGRAKTPSPEPTLSGEKPGKGRSFLASLTRRPWRALSTPRAPSPSSPTAPTLLGGGGEKEDNVSSGTSGVSETVHTAPDGDAANGVPTMPAVPDGLRSFTPTPTSPVPLSPITAENSTTKQRKHSMGHERRKESVSSLKGVSTKRPGSRGRGNSNASPITSNTGRPPGPASPSLPSDEEGGSGSSSFFKRPDNTRQNSSKSLRAKVSLERLAASVGVSSSTDIPPVPPTPTISASMAGRGFGSLNGSDASAKKRDELWGTFRTLDNDLTKFRSKSGNLRTNFIRNNVLPTLHRCANHPSNNNLRPEDLDRRANILNKWWTTLLDSLSGGQSQLAIANTDRPFYFEAITMIMTRPEFKYPFMPSSKSSANSETVISPLSNEASSGSGSASAKGTISRSKTSLDSGSSDFLTESIYHNVRNILNQNLLSQLGFCIDRMSMRHCSASLVSFSGKTCAYAFIYCPDVADTLVRLWNISPDGLRRVIAMYDPEFSMKRRANSSEEVAGCFPSPLRSLAFTSHVATVRMLRKRAIPPIAANQINWFGPWMTRWAGGDTDLFFLFVKYYYMLIAEYISIPHTPHQKLLYVPGLVLVHTQILKILEITLSRSANPIPDERSSGANGQVTFDDLIDAAETTAASPLGMANSLRHMSENRLLLLLRDIIADPQIGFELRLTFVESVCGLLKAVTRKTSLFDHNACFVLMDLGQEFIAVISSYAERINRPDLVDWDFWLDVFVQMLQSNNSSTEVRAFAFWFMMWDQVCANEKYKERLCMDLLLGDSIFYRYFNHWSAMVRAYFHRLLCWRLAQYQGEATPLDQKIFLTLQRKLSIIYEFCMSYREHHLLITAPSQPAPGRQLLIARNEPLLAQSHLICLDHSFSPPSPEAFPPPKKRWAALKSIFSSPANPKPGEVTPPGSRGSDQSSSDSSGDSSRASISDNALRPGANKEKRHEKVPNILPPSSFRFSLEWVERSPWNGQNPLLFPPTVPMPLRIYLQSLSQKNYLDQPQCSASDQAAAVLACVNMNGNLQPGALKLACNGGPQPSSTSASSHLVTPSGSESEATTSSKTSSNASDATKSDNDKGTSISSDTERDATPAAGAFDMADIEEQDQSIRDDNTVKCATRSRPGSLDNTPGTPTNATATDDTPLTEGENGSSLANKVDDERASSGPGQERQRYEEIQEDFLSQYMPGAKKGAQSPFRRAGSQRLHDLGASPGASKYAGRSLSEWAHVVDECDTHYEKRREAGVATNSMVEIPSLGVENFRK